VASLSLWMRNGQAYFSVDLHLDPAFDPSLARVGRVFTVSSAHMHHSCHEVGS